MKLHSTINNYYMVCFGFRFDRVVKLAGRPLSKAVDAFIDHVEGASTLDTSGGNLCIPFIVCHIG